MSANHSVLVLCRYLPQYRQDFFEELRAALSARGVVLDVAYGRLMNEDALKLDEVDLRWGRSVPNRVLRVGNKELYWQPCLNISRDYDLVIVEHANKLLINYALMFLRAVGRRRLAFWGHGKARERADRSLGNRLKANYLTKADWWFAYTNEVRDYVVNAGFPRERVTVAQNAIDTRALRAHYQNVPKQQVEALRAHLGVGKNAGLYCGGMYEAKGLEFLIRACDILRESIPDFQLVLIGAGPTSATVVRAAEEKGWIKYVGPKFGLDRVPYFKLARVLLIPRLVGLVVLDSFAMMTPLVTTDAPGHGPEIEYMECGKNGLIVPDDVRQYASSIAELLTDEGLAQQLRLGCAASATKYTLEAMVENFSEGVMRALDG